MNEEMTKISRPNAKPRTRAPGRRTGARIAASVMAREARACLRDYREGVIGADALIAFGSYRADALDQWGYPATACAVLRCVIDSLRRRGDI